MSNTFVTPTLVARDAALLLAANAVAPWLIDRQHETKFNAQKAGQTIKATYMSAQSASEFSSTTSAANSVENEVSLTLSKHYYVRHTLTTAERTYQLDDFTQKVTLPAVRALLDAADNYIIDVMTAGFARNLVGTDGSSPTTIANILTGRKKLQDNLAPLDQRVGILDTTAEAALLALTQFQSQDYGPEALQGLRDAVLAKRFGVDWFVDQNCGALDVGDTAGTVVIKTTVALGLATIIVDGLTEATGTIYKGTRFLIAGHTSVYTLTADATIASNEATLVFTPVLEAEGTAEDAITWKAGAAQDLIYHKPAVIGAVIPPAALLVNSAIGVYNNLGVRVSMDSSLSTLADDIVYDILVGCTVMRHEGGTVFQA